MNFYFLLDILIYEYYLIHVHLNHQINLRKVFWWSKYISTNLEKNVLAFYTWEASFCQKQLNQNDNI